MEGPPKIAIFERRYISKTIIFHIYVRFRGGKIFRLLFFGVGLYRFIVARNLQREEKSGSGHVVKWLVPERFVSRPFLCKFCLPLGGDNFGDSWGSTNQMLKKLLMEQYPATTFEKGRSLKTS